MTKIGFIGSGNVGKAVAKLAVNAGNEVLMSNSRGPESLGETVAWLGDNASAGTVSEVAAQADLVLVSIPLNKIDSLPVEQLRGKVVIDANNYYPDRDGRIPALEEETSTTSELLQDVLPESSVVKALNHIYASEVLEQVRPESVAARALIVAGDDADSKSVVAGHLERWGFDVLDLGPLSEGWRIQRDTPGYVANLDLAGLQEAVAKAKRYADMSPSELSGGVPAAGDL